MEGYCACPKLSDSQWDMAKATERTTRKDKMETLEKVNKQIKKLYTVDDRLSNVLERAGQDSETKHTQPCLDLIENLKALNSGLHALLDNHNDTIMELEYALEG